MAKLRKKAPPLTPGGIPVEMTDQLHPLWSDLEAIRQHPVFGQYVAEAALDGLWRMTGPAGPPPAFVYWRIARRWLVSNGFESATMPGHADLHRFNAAIAQ